MSCAWFISSKYAEKKHIFTQCIEIRIDSIKVDNFIIKSSSAEISLLPLHFCQIHSSQILHWTQSPHFFVSSIQGIYQILQVVPLTSSSSLLSSFNYSAKLLHCRNGPGCCSSWDISSLTPVYDGTFFPLLLPHSNFSGLICYKTFMSISLIETFAFS